MKGINVMNEKLFNYISMSPTAYHAVSHTSSILESQGFTKLYEGEKWTLETGKGYFVTRNGSSLIAFKIPSKNFKGFMMSAAHSDSPAFKIKENAELFDGNYIRLSTEKYGGMICSTWLDRPLSIAGRITVRTKKGFETKNVDLGNFCAIIPNVAIHMNRNANEGMSYNATVDMIPLFGDASSKDCFLSTVAESAGVAKNDVISTDLFLYNLDKGTEWNGFITAPRLDDLQCAFASLEGFLGAKNSKSATIYCLFDNEEVGSQTKQGAASTFLSDTLCRINSSLGGDDEQLKIRISNSFLVSCDNAHASHPNHSEYSDKNHSPYMNGGIVIKYNANQRYTTDAVSDAFFRLVCEKANVPVQSYANRADIPGGSTLGNISNTQVSLNTIDIGLAQLAMHSALETAGAKDTEYMVKALRIFFSSTPKVTDGIFEIN